MPEEAVHCNTGVGKLPVYGKIINRLSFVGQSVVPIQLCLCSRKATVDNMRLMDVRVSSKTLFTKRQLAI